MVPPRKPTVCSRGEISLSCLMLTHKRRPLWTRPGDAVRRRTFYNPDPDYSRSLFQLQAERRDRLLSRLKILYGDSQAAACMPELERIIQVHCAHKPSDMIDKERRYNATERFSESDMVLITYGDIVRGDGTSLLSVLHEFVNTYDFGAVNTIHLLPFFPYSSDRGFAVVDFSRVDPKLGTWEDIREQKRRYDLMFDAVLNHCSARSEMFREFQNDNPLYHGFFVAYASPDELTADQRSKIFRPRTSDILTRFETLHGPRYVWTTFSADQVDFNFRNPEVLLRIIDGLLFYVRHGADILRLDAVTYIWAEPGTECVHLPETHEIVKLIREVMDTAASGVALVTETNVPHAENVPLSAMGRTRPTWSTISPCHRSCCTPSTARTPPPSPAGPKPSAPRRTRPRFSTSSTPTTASA